MGAGDGDLRDAHVSLYLRGNDWQPNGSEFGFWLQCQSNIELMNNLGWRRSNNSYCGCLLTDYLMDGEWHKVEFDLINDSTLWTYGGNNSIQQGPSAVRYEYWPIDQCLAHANCNALFLSNFVNPENPPTGSVDFDELEITYCNKSLVYPGNGSELGELAPATRRTIPRLLTDGWRFGEPATCGAAPPIPTNAAGVCIPIRPRGNGGGDPVASTHGMAGEGSGNTRLPGRKRLQLRF